MSDDLDYPDVDPFAIDDPEARAREQRRLEREAKRAGTSDRAKLPEPEPVPPPEPAPAEPVPAEPLTPEPTPREPTAETDAVPEPVAVPPAHAPDDDPGAMPAPITTPLPRVRPQGPPPLAPARPAGEPPDWQIWARRVGALVIVAFSVGLILFAVTQITNDEPTATTTAVEPVKTTDVVVPEGLTIDQIGPVAKKAGLKGDYEQAAKQALKSPPKFFSLKEYGAEDAPSLEGFLFPATYEVERGAPVSDLIDKQLEAFEQNFAGVKLAYAEDKNLTGYDVVKIASMVEREVQVPKERPLVAAVIYNRLSAGDFLGIDATLRYGLEKYSGQLLESELASDDPYNTRTNPGLPPTPIGNPGLDSLEAAAKPAETDAYYFVVKPGTCGEHFFTADAAEFDSASAEYQAALEAEGGSPTEC